MTPGPPPGPPPAWIRRILHRLLSGSRGAEVLEELDREYAARLERQPRTVPWGWYLVQLFRPATWRLAWALRRIGRMEGEGAAAGSERSRSVRRGGARTVADRGFPGPTWTRGLSLVLRLAARMLARSPGLAVIGGLGIALGVAVGVGGFVVVSNLVAPTLPLDEGERLVVLQNEDVRSGEPVHRALHDFVTWRQELTTVRGLAAFTLGHQELVTSDGPPQLVRAAEMTADGFPLARVPPLLGRWLHPDDEEEAAPPVALIGHDLWRTHFQGDPGVAGRRVLVGDVVHTVVGVMPAGFAFPLDQQLWTPLRASPTAHERGTGPELRVAGRLAPGATSEQAQAELAGLGRRAAAAFPGTNGHLRPRLLPYAQGLEPLRGVTLFEMAQVQLMLHLLLVAVAVNLAVLVYARTALREGEIAVRTALGASRRRIVGQLFLEALLLSGAGAVLGLAVAHLSLQRVEAFLRSWGRVAFWVDYGLGFREAVYAAGLSICAAVVVGALPGVRFTGRALDSRLRRQGQGASVRLGRMWTVLIVA